MKLKAVALSVVTLSAHFVLCATVFAQQALVLDESCTVSVGNQTALVDESGGFVVRNIAVFQSRDTGTAPQLFRARATCVRDGEMLTGQSRFFSLTPGQTTSIADVFPSELDPIPVNISASANADFVPLGDTVQISVLAALPDGETEDVTGRSAGTTYLSTNTRLLTVTEDGLVTGANNGTGPGTGTIAILNEGNLTTIDFTAVGPSNDFDNDGMPNDYEELFGLNPFVDDADGDLDNDGLTNLREFLRGTIPTNPDTDGDGVLDGVDGDPLRPEEGPPFAEITSPEDGTTLVEGQVVLFSAQVMDDGLLTDVELSADTGLSMSFDQPPFQVSFTVPVGISGIEFTVVARDAALNETTATASVSVIPDPFTTVVGRVVDPDGTAVADALVITNGDVSSLTIADGTFSIGDVPTVFGDIEVRAEALIDGQLLRGVSDEIPATLGGITEVGDIQLALGALAMAFQQNVDPYQLSLFLSSEEPGTADIEIPGLGFEETVKVAPGAISEVAIPNAAAVLGSNSVTAQGIGVSADVEISVYGLNQRQFSTDAFAAIPIRSSDSEFRVMSYNGFSGSQFVTLAVEDNTTVTIVPSMAVDGHPAGQPFEVNLNRLETFQLQANELTGTSVSADKPVAVVSGHVCANVPPAFGACDHLTEQLPSIDAWGTRVLAVSLATRNGGDTFRILADQDDTVVQINGPDPTTVQLSAGDFEEIILNGLNEIVANKPILVAQYSNGSEFDGVPADPFMMLLGPADQFKRRYTFSTPASGFSQNFINVVAPSEQADIGGVLLDGNPIAPQEFGPIGTSGFSGARVPISLGTHTVESTTAVGVYVYGFGDFDSYGYPGGSRL